MVGHSPHLSLTSERFGGLGFPKVPIIGLDHPSACQMVKQCLNLQINSQPLSSYPPFKSGR